MSGLSRPIRIGTRDSELALWQAHKVQGALEEIGYKTELVAVKSTGDLILDKPLYELGITGIFTKTLDVAMLQGTVDIAVHSMKDVPTALPKGIVEAAVLERANPKDLLVHKGLEFLDTATGLIATGSLRRKAQWLHRYPTHQTTDLRGNVNTRMQKLNDSNWDGAIFAAAGLERINLKPEQAIELDWMIPAPAQGAMLVVAMSNDTYCQDALSRLNHKNTALSVHLERDFLRTLEGGCTAPIGALVTIKDHTVNFEGALFSLDGTKKITVKKTTTLAGTKDFGALCAQEILENGGKELMVEIKAELK